MKKKQNLVQKPLLDFFVASLNLKVIPKCKLSNYKIKIRINYRKTCDTFSDYATINNKIYLFLNKIKFKYYFFI